MAESNEPVAAAPPNGALFEQHKATICPEFANATMDQCITRVKSLFLESGAGKAYFRVCTGFLL